MEALYNSLSYFRRCWVRVNEGRQVWRLYTIVCLISGDVGYVSMKGGRFGCQIQNFVYFRRCWVHADDERKICWPYTILCLISGDDGYMKADLMTLYNIV